MSAPAPNVVSTARCAAPAKMKAAPATSAGTGTPDRAAVAPMTSASGAMLAATGTVSRTAAATTERSRNGVLVISSRPVRVPVVRDEADQFGRVPVASGEAHREHRPQHAKAATFAGSTRARTR